MTDSSNDSSTSSDTDDAFRNLRHGYLQITSQAPNRLAVSTFLAGLSFAAFAALLALSTIPVSRWPSYEDVFLLLSGLLLGWATVLFLVAAISTYAVLQRIGDVAPSTARHLQDAHPVHIESHDEARILRAHSLYAACSNMIPAGLVLVLLALPFIALHLNLVVGMLVLLFQFGVVANLVHARVMGDLVSGVQRLARSLR